MTMLTGRCRPGFLLSAGLSLVSIAHPASAEEAAPKPKATPAGGAQVMRSITVAEDALDASSEGTGSYTAPLVSAGKSLQSIREIPQSVTVITRQRLDDMNVTSLPDALKQATGVTVQRFDGAGNFNSYNVRGYAVDSIQLDGLNFGNTGNVVEFDTAIFDRVEILRGPAGLFQGSGEPSATINLARKRALAETKFGVAARIGSWNALRGEVDATGALAQDGRLRGRVVAAYDERDSYQNAMSNEKKIVYGTLEYDLTPSTTASVGATWQDIDAVVDQGLPAYANGTLLDVSRATLIGADWNRQELESKDMFAEIEHHLEGGGELKAAVRKLDRFMLYKVARANGAVTPAGTTNIQTGLFSPDRQNVSADAYANLPFSFGGLTHNFIAGVDWRTQGEKSNTSPFVNAFTQNVFVPDLGSTEPPIVYTNRSQTETEQYGAYSQLRIKATPWLTVVGGGRVSWWESTSHNLVTGAVTADSEQRGEFTPFAAMIAELLPQVSVYMSYADVFQPQADRNIAGEQLPPRTGGQIEAGIKAELFDQALNAQFAVFQIKDRDRALADTSPGAPPNVSIASGEVESKGFDTEIAGQVLHGWDIVVGYAYTDTEYVTSTAAQTGQVFAPFTPRHVGNVWTKYAFSEGVLKGLEVGGGVKAVSSFYSPAGAVRFVAPAYTVVTAQLGYEFTPTLHANLTVNNLLDEKYYEKVSGASRQNFYGDPLNVALSLRASF